MIHEGYIVCKKNDEMKLLYKSNEVTSLMNAAQRGDIDLLRKLLAEGHTVNESNFDSVTALHEACLAGQVETAKFLLQQGANVNARNIDGGTPLCDACSNGNVECVALLLSNGADINPKLTFYTTPLHEAVLRDHADVVKILIENGVNLEGNDLHFGRPLHLAAYKGHVASGRLLLQAGALVNAHHRHQTALHMAAANQNESFIHLLVEFGADLYVENNVGQRPLHTVPQRSRAHEVLLEYESNVESLYQLCRLAVRRHLKLSDLRDAVPQLGLPSLIVKYLLHHI